MTSTQSTITSIEGEHMGFLLALHSGYSVATGMAIIATVLTWV
jgi:hypothetical protein